MMEITPEMQELIDAQVAEKSAALEEEKNRIAQNARKLLDEKKNLEQRLQNFDGVDVEEYSSLKEQLKSLNEEGLLKDGKIDELVARRIESAKLEYEQRLAEERTRAEELEKKNGSLASSFDEYRIRDAITQAAIAAKMLDPEDAILRATDKFTVDEEGHIYIRDKEGNVVVDENSKPITPKSFVNSLKKTAAHLWPNSEGANLAGSNDDGSVYGKGSSLDAAAKAGNMRQYRKARLAQKKGSG